MPGTLWVPPCSSLGPRENSASSSNQRERIYLDAQSRNLWRVHTSFMIFMMFYVYCTVAGVYKWYWHVSSHQMSPIDVLTHPCILIFLISYRDVTSCSDSTSSMDVSCELFRCNRVSMPMNSHTGPLGWKITKTSSNTKTFRCSSST